MLPAGLGQKLQGPRPTGRARERHVHHLSVFHWQRLEHIVQRPLVSVCDARELPPPSWSRRSRPAGCILLQLIAQDPRLKVGSGCVVLSQQRESPLSFPSGILP